MDELSRNFRPVTIYKAPAGKSALYASLVDFGDGEVLCAFRTSSMDESAKMPAGNPWTNLDDEIVCIKSFDGCRTWNPNTLRPIFGDPTMYDYLDVTSAPLLRDGTVLLPFYQCAPDHDEGDPATWKGGMFLIRSRDRGQTWSSPELFDPSPVRHVASFGGIIRLQNGDLLLSCYGDVSHPGSAVAPGMGAALAFRSCDDGSTWGELAHVAYEADAASGEGCRGLNETSITQLGDGRVLAVSRSYYHDQDYPLYQSVSTENGFTWSTERSHLHGLCPCLRWVPQGPDGGTVVLAYHDRYVEHQERGGIYLAFSYDCGATWSYQTYVDTFAYPCLLQLASGEMLLAYYSSDHTELRGVFFDVPFPAGIRAQVSGDAVELGWGAPAAGGYTYRVHRSPEAGFEPNESNALCAPTGHALYRDDTAEAAAACYYVVTAWSGGKQVGKSWELAVTP